MLVKITNSLFLAPDQGSISVVVCLLLVLRLTLQIIKHS